MATKKYTVKYVGSVTPKKTKFLTSPAIKMDFDGELELDETDASKFKEIQKEFQKQMASQLKTQLKHLDTWLNEKDQLVATMVKKHEDIKKFGFPSTASEAKAYAAKNKALSSLAEETQNLKNDYVKIVNDWAENARKQQGLICLTTALKKARAKTLSNKTWRVRAGIAIKVVLVVAAVALSIAAIALTAGATAPIFVGLATTGLALTGVASFTDVVVKIKNNASIEKKILNNVQKDVKAVEAALKPVAGVKTSLAKHVTELVNVMKVRVDSIKKVKSSMQEKKAQIGGYDAQLAKLTAALAQQAPPDKKMLAEVASRKKKIADLKKQVKSLEAKMVKMDQDNKDAVALLQQLKDMNVQLDKISGQSANTVAGNLKTRFTSLEGWIEFGNDLGGLASGISGAHA
jgi:multidrug transporter EmrE-like cation transporter